MTERRLIVMRHAKSSWDTDAATDHERPLNKRGRRSAPLIAAELIRLGWRPDAVLSSDSTRTQETFERMRDHLGAPPAEFTNSLYHAGFDEIHTALLEQSEDVRTLLVLGHNPGWEEAVTRLSGVMTSMQTACAALLSVQAADWAEAAARAGHWTLHDVIRPRGLE